MRSPAIDLEFGTAFLVVITVIFLWDLDEPIGGAISVSGVPKDWLHALRALQEKDEVIDVVTDRAEAERTRTAARDEAEHSLPGQQERLE